MVDWDSPDWGGHVTVATNGSWSPTHADDVDGEDTDEYYEPLNHEGPTHEKD